MPQGHRPMRAPLLLSAVAILALAGCNASDAPSGVTPDEEAALNAAAAKLDAATDQAPAATPNQAAPVR